MTCLLLVPDERFLSSKKKGEEKDLSIKPILFLGGVSLCHTNKGCAGRL